MGKANPFDSRRIRFGLRLGFRLGFGMALLRLSADVESAARDWSQLESEAAKPIVGERPMKVSVQEVRDEIET